jgi:hypothetical protein
MGIKLVSAQKPFTMITAPVRGSSDPSRGPSGNPVIAHKSYTSQFIIEIGRSKGPDCFGSTGLISVVGMSTYTGAAPVASSGTVTVTAPFDGPTTLYLGQYAFTSGEDFVDAPSLAVAISTAPGYSAVEAGGVVTITGPVGLMGNELTFISNGVSSGNLVLDPNYGHLSGAEPYIGPPILG